MPSAAFNSQTASEGQERTPFDDLMLHPNVHGLHLF